ncbi:MAG: hypothetical protein RL095_909 [Verrucomicrobiota bacterium]|jgi:hypothetical protein
MTFKQSFLRYFEALGGNVAVVKQKISHYNHRIRRLSANQLVRMNYEQPGFRIAPKMSPYVRPENQGEVSGLKRFSTDAHRYFGKVFGGHTSKKAPHRPYWAAEETKELKSRLVKELKEMNAKRQQEKAWAGLEQLEDRVLLSASVVTSGSLDLDVTDDVNASVDAISISFTDATGSLLMGGVDLAGPYASVDTIDLLSFNSTDALTIDGTAGADTFEISSTSITFGSTTINYGNIRNITINGLDDNDVVNVDGTLDNGLSLTFNGGAGTDTMNLTGNNASFDYGVVDGDTFKLGAAQNTIANFSSLEGLFYNVTGTNSLAIHGTAGANNFALDGNSMNFAGIVGSVAGINAITLNGSGGTDSFTFVDTAGDDVITMSGGNLSNGTRTIDVNTESLTILSTGGNDRILNDGSFVDMGIQVAGNGSGAADTFYAEAAAISVDLDSDTITERTIEIRGIAKVSAASTGDNIVLQDGNGTAQSYTVTQVDTSTITVSAAGLVAKYYNYAGTSLLASGNTFAGQTVVGTEIKSDISLVSAIASLDNVGQTLDGILTILPGQEGVYTFALSADDCAGLWIDGILVTSVNDFPTNTPGSNTHNLTVGEHRIHIEFVEVTVGAGIALTWDGAVTTGPEAIASSFLSHKITLTKPSTGSLSIDGNSQDSFIINGSGVADSYSWDDSSSTSGTFGFGTLNSAINNFTTLTVNGNAGDDIFTTDSNVPAFNGGSSTNGDILAVNGTAGADAFIVASAAVTIDAGADGATTPDVVINSFNNVEIIRINASNGANTLSVSGSLDVEYTGGVNNDAVTVTGAAGADTFVLTSGVLSNGATDLTMSSVENLTINSGAGNDSVTSDGSLASLTVDGGANTDTLNVTGTAGADSITASNVETVTIVGGGGADTASITGAGVTATVSQTESVSYNGSAGGTNSLTIDDVATTLFNYTGGAGTDTVVFSTSAAGDAFGDAVKIDVTALGSGSIQLEDDVNHSPGAFPTAFLADYSYSYTGVENITINGGALADALVLTNKSGADPVMPVVTYFGGAGNDVIYFDAESTAYRTSKLGTDRTLKTSTNEVLLNFDINDTLYVINSNLSQQPLDKTELANGLSRLIDLMAGFKDYDEMAASFPFLNDTVTFGALLGPDTIMTAMRDRFNTYFSSYATPTLQDLVNFLEDTTNGWAGIAGYTWTVTFDSNSDVDLKWAKGRSGFSALFDMKIEATKTTTAQVMDRLDDNNQNLYASQGFAFGGGNVTFDVNSKLTFDIVLDAGDNFGITIQDLKAEFSTANTTVDVGTPTLLRVGILDTDVSSGSVNVSATVNTTFPATEVQYADLALASYNNNAIEMFDSLSTSISGTGSVDADFSLTPVSASGLTLEAGGVYTLQLGAGSAVNLFDIKEPAPLATFSDDLNGFRLLNSQALMQPVEAYVNWLRQLAGSDLFDGEIPMADGRTLGDVLDFAEAFQTQLSNSLYTVDAEGNLASTAFTTLQQFVALTKPAGSSWSVSFDKDSNVLLVSASLSKTLQDQLIGLKEATNEFGTLQKIDVRTPTVEALSTPAGKAWSLAADASLNLTLTPLGGVATSNSFSLTAANTNDNASIADLAGDINTLLDAVTVAGQTPASSDKWSKFVQAVIQGNRIVLAVREGANLDLTADVAALGFLASDIIISGTPNPTLMKTFQLRGTDDAVLKISLDGALAHTATMTAASTSTNTSSTDLLADLNTALSTSVGTGNGATTVFTVPDTLGTLAVFVNGVHQPNTAYTISGTTLTFTAAPAASADIRVGQTYASLTGDGRLAINSADTAKALTVEFDEGNAAEQLGFVSGIKSHVTLDSSLLATLDFSYTFTTVGWEPLMASDPVFSTDADSSGSSTNTGGQSFAITIDNGTSNTYALSVPAGTYSGVNQLVAALNSTLVAEGSLEDKLYFASSSQYFDVYNESDAVYVGRVYVSGYDTRTNTTLANLISDLDQSLAAAVLADGSAMSTVLDASSSSGKVSFTGIGALAGKNLVINFSGSTLGYQMGFNTAQLTSAATTLVASSPPASGVLSSDSNFSVSHTISGGSAVTHTFTLTASATNDNNSNFMLLQDVNALLAATTYGATTDKWSKHVKASLNSDGTITLAKINTADTFSVTAATSQLSRSGNILTASTANNFRLSSSTIPESLVLFGKSGSASDSYKSIFITSSDPVSFKELTGFTSGQFTFASHISEASIKDSSSLTAELDLAWSAPSAVMDFGFMQFNTSDAQAKGHLQVVTGMNGDRNVSSLFESAPSVIASALDLDNEDLADLVGYSGPNGTEQFEFTFSGFAAGTDTADLKNKLVYSATKGGLADGEPAAVAELGLDYNMSSAYTLLGSAKVAGNGQINGNAGFDITIGGATKTVSLLQGLTLDNSSAALLANDLTSAIRKAGHQEVTVTEEGGFLVIKDGLNRQITLSNLTGTAGSDLKLSAGSSVQKLIGGVAAPSGGDASEYRLSQNAVFTLNGTQVTITAAATNENTSAANFLADVNAALATAGLNTSFSADLFSDRLVFTRTSGSGAFTISVAEATEITARNGNNIDSASLIRASSTDVIAALEKAAEFLADLSTEDLLGADIPVLDMSLDGINPFAAEFGQLIAETKAKSFVTYSEFQAYLNEAFRTSSTIDGITPEVNFIFNADILQLGLKFVHTDTVDYSLNLNLYDLAALDAGGTPAELDNENLVLITVNSPTVLDVKSTAVVNLDIEIDYAVEEPELTLKNTSSASLSFAAVTEDVRADILIGAKNLSIINGTIVFDADGDASTDDKAVYTIDFDNDVSLAADATLDVANDLSVSLAGQGMVELPFFNTPSLLDPVTVDFQDGSNEASSVGFAFASLQDLAEGIDGSVEIVTEPGKALPGLASVAESDFLTILRNPDLVIAGIDRLLRMVEISVSAPFEAMGEIPLVGDRLYDAVKPLLDTLSSMRINVRSYLQNQFDAAGLSDNDLIIKFQEIIYNIFGPSGLDILVDRRGDLDNLVQQNDVLVRTFIDGENDGVEYDFRLGQEYAVSVPFEFGFGGSVFGLEVDGGEGLTIEMSWDFDFGFGIALQDLFYFVVDHSDGYGNDLPELRASIDVTIPGFSAEVNLGVLGAVIEDGFEASTRVTSTTIPILDFLPVTGKNRAGTFKVHTYDNTGTLIETLTYTNSSPNIDPLSLIADMNVQLLSLTGGVLAVPVFDDPLAQLENATTINDLGFSIQLKARDVDAKHIRIEHVSGYDFGFIDSQFEDQRSMTLGFSDGQTGSTITAANAAPAEGELAENALIEITVAGKTFDFELFASSVEGVIDTAAGFQNINIGNVQSGTGMDGAAELGLNSLSNNNTDTVTGAAFFNPASPVNSDFRINSDAIFDITVDGETHTVKVAWGKTSGNTSADELVEDIQDAINAAGLVMSVGITNDGRLEFTEAVKFMEGLDSLVSILNDEMMIALGEAGLNTNGITFSLNGSNQLVLTSSIGSMALGVDTRDKSHISLVFEANVVDTGEGDEDDGRLTISEISIEALEASIKGEAMANLQINGNADALTALLGSTGIPGLGNLGLPEVNFGFHTGFSAHAEFAEGETSYDYGFENLEFHNVSVDAGSLISSIIKPIAGTIFKLLDPIIQIVGPAIVTGADAATGFLYSDIPILSDLANYISGIPSKVIDLIPGGQQIVNMINAIKKLVELITALSDYLANYGDENIIINLGNWAVVTDPESPLFIGKTKLPIPLEIVELFDAVTQAEENANEAGGSATGSASALSNILRLMGVQNDGSSQFTSTPAGFQLDFFKIQNIFNLILGKPFDIISYNFVEVHVSAGFNFGFGFGSGGNSLNFSIGGRVWFDAAFSVVYDSNGFDKIMAAKDAGLQPNYLDLLDGFAVRTKRGNEVEAGISMYGGGGISIRTPEIRIPIYYPFGKTYLTIPAITIFAVQCNISANLRIGLDLRDPNEDGKLRLDEIIDIMTHEDGSIHPECLITMFDINGSVSASFYFSATIMNATVNINADVDVSFSLQELFGIADALGCDAFQPKLATLLADTRVLRLNAGEFAAERIHGDSDDSDGVTMYVFSPGSGTYGANTVTVRMGSTTKSYDGSSFDSIMFRGLQGADTIDASGLGSKWSVDLRGGAGNDNLTGGAGNDLILGGLGNDILSGGGGNDYINAGQGNDTLRGGADQDFLVGGRGDDNTDGGGGADKYLYGTTSEDRSNWGNDSVGETDAGTGLTALAIAIESISELDPDDNPDTTNYILVTITGHGFSGDIVANLTGVGGVHSAINREIYLERLDADSFKAYVSNAGAKGSALEYLSPYEAKAGRGWAVITNATSLSRYTDPQGRSFDSRPAALKNYDDNLDFSTIRASKSLNFVLDGSGTSVSIGGSDGTNNTVTSTGLSIERMIGGQGDDTFSVSATSSRGVVLDGGEGSDDYFITDSPSILGDVYVFDQGTVPAIDRLFVQGSSGTDNIGVTSQKVHLTSGRDIQYRPGNFDGGAEKIIFTLNEGDDFLNIESSSAKTTLDIFTNDGADTIRFGVLNTTALSTAAGNQVATGERVNLAGIDTETVINVDAGYHGDFIQFYDTTEIANQLGKITNNFVRGFGIDPDGGVKFVRSENLFFDLGSGADTLDEVADLTNFTVTANGNDGNDTFTIRKNLGTVTLDGGNGNDGFYIGTKAFEYFAAGALNETENGLLDGIHGIVNITGGANTDTVVLDDSLNTETKTGNLTDTSISGLGMSNSGLAGVQADNLGTVNYSTENLIIYLGQNNDRLFVTDSHTGSTTIVGNQGDDSVLATQVSGSFSVEGDNASLNTANSTEGRDYVYIGTVAANAVVDISLEDGGDQVVDITTIVAGTGSVTVNTGSGADALRFESVNSDLTVTTTGGDDTVFIDTNNATTSVNTGANNDEIYIRANTSIGALTLNSSTGNSFVKFGAEAPDQWQQWLEDVETALLANPAIVEDRSDNAAAVTMAAEIENSGNINSIEGSISVTGNAAGTNIVEINDDGGDGSDLVLEDGAIFFGNATQGTLTYANTDYLNIFGSSSADQIDILSANQTTDTFVLLDQGADEINLGFHDDADFVITGLSDNSRTLAALDGFLRLDANAGYNLQSIVDFRTLVTDNTADASTAGVPTSINTWDETGDDLIVLHDVYASGINTGRISNTQIDGFGIDRTDDDAQVQLQGAILPGNTNPVTPDTGNDINAGSLRYFDFDDMVVNFGAADDILNLVGVFEGDDSADAPLFRDSNSTIARTLVINADAGSNEVKSGTGIVNGVSTDVELLPHASEKFAQDPAFLNIAGIQTEARYGIEGIFANVTVNSVSGGNNILTVDDSNNTAPNTFVVTAPARDVNGVIIPGINYGSITGSGRSANGIGNVIYYDATQSVLNLLLGQNNDRVFIEDTFDGITNIVGNQGDDTVIAKSLHGTVNFQGDNTDLTLPTEGNDRIFVDLIQANARVTITMDSGDDVVDIGEVLAGTGFLLIAGEEGDDQIRVGDVGTLTNPTSLTIHGDLRDSNNTVVNASDKDRIFVDHTDTITTITTEGDDDEIYVRAIDAGATTSIDAGLTGTGSDFVKLGAEAPDEWQQWLLDLANALIDDNQADDNLNPQDNLNRGIWTNNTSLGFGVPVIAGITVIAAVPPAPGTQFNGLGQEYLTYTLSRPHTALPVIPVIMTQNSGLISGIQADVSVEGGDAGGGGGGGGGGGNTDGVHYNYLEFNDDKNTAGTRMVLENNRISLLDSSGNLRRITYNDIDFLNLFTGSGDDRVDVVSTHINTDTFILLDAGDDTVNLNSSTDLINNEVISRQNSMEHLVGYLRIDGNAGYNKKSIDANADIVVNTSALDNTWQRAGYDTLNLVNTSVETDGRISNTQIDGFGIDRDDTDRSQPADSGSLRYYDFDRMNVNLGGFNDKLSIVGVFDSGIATADESVADAKQGTAVSSKHRQLILNTGEGNDSVSLGVGSYFRGAADDNNGISKTDIDSLPIADDINDASNLSRVHADVIVNAGMGDDSLYIDDSTDIALNTGYMTASYVAGLGRSNRDGAGDGDTENDVAILYDTDIENLSLYLGQNSDRLFIESTFANNTTIIGNGGGDAFLANTLNGTVTIEGDSSLQNLSQLDGAIFAMNATVVEGDDHFFISTVAGSAVVTLSGDRGDDIFDVHTVGLRARLAISGEEGDDGVRIENIMSQATVNVDGDGRDLNNRVSSASDKDIVFVDFNGGTLSVDTGSDNDRIYLRGNDVYGTANLQAGSSRNSFDNEADTSERADLQSIDDVTNIVELDFIKIGAEAPNQWQDRLVNLENGHVNDGSANGYLGRGTDLSAYNDGGATWVAASGTGLDGAWNGSTSAWRNAEGDAALAAATEDAHSENVGDLSDLRGTVNIDGGDQNNRNYLEINDSGVQAQRDLVLDDDRVTIVHSSNLGRINYLNIDFLNLFLSQGDDRIDVTSTHDQTDTFILGGSGDDSIILGASSTLINDENYQDGTLNHIRGYLNLQANAGYNRTFITRPEDFELDTLTPMVSIASELAGASHPKNSWTLGGYDSITLNAQGNLNFLSEGRISNSQIDGFGIERQDTDLVSDSSVTEATDKGGLRYFDFDKMTVNLSNARDILHVYGVFESAIDRDDESKADIKQGSAQQSIKRQLIVNTNSGDDVITLGVGTYSEGASGTNGISKPDITQLPAIDAINDSSSLDRIFADVTLDAGFGNDSLHVDDSADSKVNTGTLSATAITGLGRNDRNNDNAAENDNAVNINYGLNLESLNIYLGTQGDRLFVTDTFANSTAIFGNGGADAILVTRLSGTVDIHGDSSTQNLAAVNSMLNYVTTNVLEEDDSIFIDDISADAVVTIGGDRGDDLISVGTIAYGSGSVSISGEEGDDQIRVLSAASPLSIYGDGRDSINADTTATDNDRISIGSASAATLVNAAGGSDEVYLKANSGAGSVSIDTGVTPFAGRDFVKLGAEAPSQWISWLAAVESARSFNPELIKGGSGISFVSMAALVQSSGDLAGIRANVDVKGSDLVSTVNGNYLELNDDAATSGRKLVVESNRITLVHNAAASDTDAGNKPRITYSDIDFLNLFSGNFDDQVDIVSTQLNTDTFVLLDEGDDTVNLGSSTALIGNEVAAVLNSLQYLNGYLRIDGNAGYKNQSIDQHDDLVLSGTGGANNTWKQLGYDTVNLNNSGTLTSNGRISNTQIDGFGIARDDLDGSQDAGDGSLRYFDFDKMGVVLGGGADILKVVGVFESATLNRDESIADLKQGTATQTAQRLLNIDGGAGNDAITLGVGSYSGGASGINGISKADIAGLPAVDGLTDASGLNNIFANVSVVSGLGTDSLHIDDSTDTKVNTGTLSATSISGLGRNDRTGDGLADNDNNVGINYSTDTENFNLYLGANNDRLFITDTFANNSNIYGNGGSDAFLATLLRGRVDIQGDSSVQNLAALDAAVTGIIATVSEATDYIFVKTVAAGATVNLSGDAGNDVIDVTTVALGTGSLTISGEEGDDQIRVEAAGSTTTIYGDNRDANNPPVTASDKDRIFVDTATAVTKIYGGGDNDNLYLRANSGSGAVTLDGGTGTDGVKLGAEAPTQWQTWLVNLATALGSQSTTVNGGSIANVTMATLTANVSNMAAITASVTQVGNETAALMQAGPVAKTATAPGLVAAAASPVLGGIAQDLQLGHEEEKWSSYGSQEYRVFAGFDAEEVFVDNYLAPVKPAAAPVLPSYKAAAPLRFQSFANGVSGQETSLLTGSFQVLPALPSDEEIDQRLREELRKSFELSPESQQQEQPPAREAAPAEEPEDGKPEEPKAEKSGWKRSLESVLSFFFKL